MSWKIKDNIEPTAESGTYFLRTSLKMSEKTIWDVYNIIREIEYSFRTLKTDLDLRPIYHKKDRSTMAHLNLGLLAYWIVNTVRYQLKQRQIHYQWKEILRIMQTHKAVTTVSQNRYDEVIVGLRTSDPSSKVQAIYDALHYKLRPFTKRKFVVHKSEFEKMNLLDYRMFPT
jgi:transposase